MINRGINHSISHDIYGWYLPDQEGETMGERVEVPVETANFLTQRARVLERRGDKVILEMPDVVGEVTEPELGRIFRRFRWLLGQRRRPDDD